MADKMETKPSPHVTIWLTRCGYHPDGDPQDPRLLYTPVRLQNTIQWRIGDKLDDADIEKLIAQGVTVDIS